MPLEHKLEGDKLNCPCCGKARVCIGTEVTEQLEHFPASFKVLQHVQHKYACRDCDQAGRNPQIELAPKPPQPIDKALAGPGLLAYVITSRLADHLPLYRLYGQKGQESYSTGCRLTRSLIALGGKDKLSPMPRRLR